MHDKKINDGLASVIAQLPAAWQVLCIEPHHHIVVADEDQITRLYSRINKKRESVLGFFYGDKVMLDNFELSFPTAFQRESRGIQNGVTIMHEKGHDFDVILGAQEKIEEELFFSSANAAWKQAVDYEASRQLQYVPYEEEDPDDILSWPKKRLAKVVTAHIKSDELYEDYRHLMKHLALYETKDARYKEAFAEMCTHYATLFAQTGGNLASIDIKLTQRYPDLWSHFRDEVLPKLEEIAKRLVADRNNKINLYLVAAEDLARSVHEPFDAVAALRRAKIAHARGKLNEAFEDIARVHAMLESPYENYANAVIERDELYADYGRVSNSPPNQTQLMNRASEIVQAEGHQALGETYLAVDAETRSFKKFITEYERCVAAVSDVLRLNDYFYAYHDKKNAAGAFYSIYRRGGEDAVNAHLEYLPNDNEIETFRDVYADSVRTKEEILQTPDDFRKEEIELTYETVEQLRSIVECGNYNEIRRRSRQIARDTISLKSYHDKLWDFVASVGEHTYGMANMVSGQRILDDVTTLKELGGLQSLRKKGASLKIDDNTLQAYVNTRIYHWDWSKQMAEQGRNIQTDNVGGLTFLSNPTKEVPESVYAKIADDLVCAGMSGGADEIRTRTKEFALLITDMKQQSRGLSAGAGGAFAPASKGEKSSRVTIKSFSDFGDLLRRDI